MGPESWSHRAWVLVAPWRINEISNGKKLTRYLKKERLHGLAEEVE